MRLIWCWLGLVACARDHEVKLLLGPDEESLSIGFKCVQQANPGQLLFARAVDGTAVKFNLVVDVVGFGGGFPGCRGEEIVRECERGGNCRVLTRPNGAKRFCSSIEFSTAIANDDTAIRQVFGDALADELIVDPAPDEPVLFRVVATTQPCDAIDDVVDGRYPRLDIGLAVGCAYSCPASLDAVDRPLTISLDTLSRDCEPLVRACAGFPANVSKVLGPTGARRRLRVK
ncbi:MAG: hypothetical protein WKG01_04860 [Kofleriaceae bacterium]